MMYDGTTEHALPAALSAAVPLWQMDLKRVPLDELLAECPAIGQLLAEKGDVLLFGGKKGEAAHIFNQVARGIAIMSFLPGGVTLFGEHWEAQHPDQEAS